MFKASIAPNLADGIFVGTQINKGRLELAPAVMLSSYPLNETYWSKNGSGWVAEPDGDRVTIDNTAGSNLFLGAIYSINQSTIKDVIFRLIVEAVGIASSGFAIQMILTDEDGLGGTVVGTKQVVFPPGTWPEQQFTIEITPTAPAHWLYAYIFSTNVGKMTSSFAEIYQEGDPAGKYGWWKSPAYDLAKLANQPITSGTLPLIDVGFYYSTLDNVDGLGSVAHSIEVLSKWSIMVGNEPLLNTTSRQQQVQQALLEKGIQLYGYAQIGPFAGEVLDDLITAAKLVVDRCAAAGYTGVFGDMFGYDWGVTRAAQNEIVSYTHSKGLKFFANGWHPSDTLGSTIDATYNPDGTPPELGEGDWYLFESFYSQSSSYAGSSGIFLDTFKKYTSGIALAKELKVNTCGLTSSIFTEEISDYADWINSYLLAVGLGMTGLNYIKDLDGNVLQWSPDDLPPQYCGSQLVNPYAQVSPTTYEAITDQGIIQFTALDSPNPVSRSTGKFKSAGPSHVSVTIPPVIADGMEIRYFSSADGLTWSQIPSPTTSERYFGFELHLRNS